MASVHKYSPGRSKYFFGKYRDSDGRVRCRSTKQKDRSKALAVVLEWERAAEMARAGVLTEAQCRRVIGEILERTTGETLRHVTAREFLDNWLKGKELAKSEGTHLRYENSVKFFYASLGARADKPLNAIAPRDLEKFRDSELKAGKAQSTVSVDLKTLRSAFNNALRQGLITLNPVSAIELPKDVRHERDTFSGDQIRGLFKAAGPEWRTAIMFGYYVAARLSDAVTMQFQHMDFPARVMRYRHSKTNRMVECPMHPDLEDYLLSLPVKNRDPNTELTPSLACRPVGGRSGLSREFKDIMAAAGVADGRIEGKGGRGRAFSRLSFHALRHSFVTHLAAAGIAREIRMKLSGHTNENVHDKYTRLQLDPMREAVSKLSSVTKAKQS